MGLGLPGTDGDLLAVRTPALLPLGVLHLGVFMCKACVRVRVPGDVGRAPPWGASFFTVTCLPGPSNSPLTHQESRGPEA